jgi:YHS domain-containing protein
MKKLFLTLVLACGAIAAFAAEPLVCPVMGKPVPADALAVQFRGLQVQFCCPGCDVEFTKDPESFLKKADADGKVVAASLFDPVSRQRQSETTVTRDYRGVRYPFASEANAAKFDETPELFTSAPLRESLVCPVLKNKIASYAEAAGYADHSGVRYYFCCPGCDVTFAATPDVYAASVKKSVRDVHPTASDKAASKEARIMPTCAGCAGEARLLSADGTLANRWTLSYRYVNERNWVAARHRVSLDYALSPRLAVGIERAGSDNASHKARTNGLLNTLRFSDGDTALMPRASWFITGDGRNHPSLVLGMASDRLSTPHGQAFFLTAAKSIPNSPLTPFISVKNNTWNGRTVFPFGANLRLAPGYTFQAIHDGDHTHLLLTKLGKNSTYSLLLAQSKYVGFAWSVGF